jgi:site-specific DNA-methyltransferase (adenine-specific)
MKLERAKLDSLTCDPANVRKHDQRNLDAIKGSLQRFGQQHPIIVDGDGIIRAGNGRYMAMRALGWSECDIVRTALKGAEATAFAIADNRTAELATWDDEALAQQLAALQIEDEELALATGYDEKEIAALALDSVEVQEDEIPEPPADPITKPGDLWLLGEHRVLCGDSTKAEDVARLMDGANANAVVTDPPYGIDFGYDKHQDDEDQWFVLMNKVIPILRKMAPFVVMPSCKIDRLGWWYQHHQPDWMMCWYKGSPGHQSKVGFNDWEPHLVWGRPPRAIHDFWQTKCGFDVDGHPCPKPVEYSAWLVERSAEAGGLIYDPFLGSGTTLIAAEQLGRKCYGMEISPAYCDVIVKRWEALTGKQAQRA